MSSYDVIRKIKSEYQKGTKIGHGGTLDPLAEGVLVIGIGRESTKQLDAVLKNSTKEYVAGIELGKISETDDGEGPITAVKPAPQEPSRAEIKNVLQSFIGDIQQTPPPYSAVKVAGTPAYKRARRGEDVKLQPKTVHIRAIEILDYSYPMLEIRVECGSGVYIRALARDIGEKLKTGGYIVRLVRTRVGGFMMP